LKTKIKNFSKNLSHGIKQEYQETKQIPKQLMNKEYKAAAQQVGDIGKMVFVASLWVLPAGGVASACLLKASDKFRPSAFQNKEDETKE